MPCIFGFPYYIFGFSCFASDMFPFWVYFLKIFESNTLIFCFPFFPFWVYFLKIFESNTLIFSHFEFIFSTIRHTIQMLIWPLYILPASKPRSRKDLKNPSRTTWSLRLHFASLACLLALLNVPIWQNCPSSLSSSVVTTVILEMAPTGIRLTIINHDQQCYRIMNAPRKLVKNF